MEELNTIAKGSNGEFITKELVELFRSRVRRRIKRGLGHKYNKFIEKIRKSK